MEFQLNRGLPHFAYGKQQTRADVLKFDIVEDCSHSH